MSLDDVALAIQTKEGHADFPIKLVAIDGHGGAGKSTLAATLAKKLGAEILHTDDFASWEEPYEWWPRFMQDVIKPIKAGAKTLSYERSSWWEDHHPDPVKDQQVTPIMVLEGATAARKEFRPYLTYAIWVEAPKEVCLARALERDGEEALPLWEKWWVAEEEYIKRDNPQTYVDVTISGTT